MESNLIMRHVRQQLHVQSGVRRQQTDGGGSGKRESCQRPVAAWGLMEVDEGCQAAGCMMRGEAQFDIPAS